MAAGLARTLHFTLLDHHYYVSSENITNPSTPIVPKSPTVRCREMDDLEQLDAAHIKVDERLCFC